MGPSYQCDTKFCHHGSVALLFSSAVSRTMDFELTTSNLDRIIDSDHGELLTNQNMPNRVLTNHIPGEADGILLTLPRGDQLKKSSDQYTVRGRGIQNKGSFQTQNCTKKKNSSISKNYKPLLLKIYLKLKDFELFIIYFLAYL